MIFDIIIFIILILTMVFGFRRGFVYSFLHTLGFAGSLIIAFFGARFVQGQLQDRTMTDEKIYNIISENISSSLDFAVSPSETLPKIISDSISTAASATAAMLAEQLTGFVMLAISFLLIFIIFKMICYIVITIFSRKNNDGFIGAADGLLGLAAGFLKGILVIFVLLSMLALGMNLMSPASAEIFMISLEESYIAKTLYDANFLLLVLGF